MYKIIKYVCIQVCIYGMSIHVCVNTDVVVIYVRMCEYMPVHACTYVCDYIYMYEYISGICWCMLVWFLYDYIYKARCLRVSVYLCMYVQGSKCEGRSITLLYPIRTTDIVAYLRIL